MGNYTITPQVLNSDTKKSKHTGKDLEIIEISFRTDTEIEVPKFVYSVGNNKKWKAHVSSYSYTDGNPIKRYNVKLEEVEELNIENIVINGNKFEPYFYEEEIDLEDDLRIKANVKLDETNWLVLKDLIYNVGSVTVVREGISDDEIEMGFAKTVWSEHDGEYKCRIILISQNDSKGIAILRPDIDNIKNIIIRQSKTIDKLLLLLLEKDVINESEKERLMEREEINPLDYSIFDKTMDLDEFLEFFI